MDLAAELARFNPDPVLANWITGSVQTRVAQAQKDRWNDHSSGFFHS
jgi:hypothetical protein